MRHGNARAKSNTLPPATTTRNKIPNDNRFSMPGAKRMQHAVQKANNKEFPNGTPVTALHCRNRGRQLFTENLLLTSNEHIEGFRFLYRLFRFCNSRRHRYSRFIYRSSIHSSTFLRHHDLSRGRNIPRPTDIKTLLLDCSRNCNRNQKDKQKYNRLSHSALAKELPVPLI